MESLRPDGDRIRVLHVDDSPAVRRLVEAGLTGEFDLDVVSEETAADGLERLDDDIDCIVSDYQLPGRDGLEFLTDVRERDSDVPFILFTGHGSEDIASQAISAGVTDYLQKGSGDEQFDLLANRVQNAVEGARVERKLDDVRARYERLMKTAPDAIFVVDAADGTIIDANNAAADLLGRSKGELRGTHQTKLHPAGERDRYASIFRDHADSSGVIHEEDDLEVVHADGTRVPVEISAASVELADREVVQAIFRDVSGRSE